MRRQGRSPTAPRYRIDYPAARAAPGAHAAQPCRVHYLISIGLDGLNARLLRGLIRNGLAGDYTHFRRFGNEGVTPFEAHSDYTHNVTLPNRIVLTTGRPVLRPAGRANTEHHFPMNH